MAEQPTVEQQSAQARHDRGEVVGQIEAVADMMEHGAQTLRETIQAYLDKYEQVHGHRPVLREDISHANRAK